MTVRVAPVGPTGPGVAHPGCGVACAGAPAEAAEVTGADPVGEAPWVGAAGAVAPWAAVEDPPWVAVGAALALDAAVLDVEVPCGAGPEGTEETGERGLTRCSGERRLPLPPFSVGDTRCPLSFLTSLPSCSSPSHKCA